MPNGRFVSKAIAVNGQLASVSLEADFLFGRCIPHLDVDGRMSGNPKLVKAIAVPVRDELSIERVAACLAELAAAELVVWYQVNGELCLTFPSFARHQQGLKREREADSRVPSPRSPNAVKVTPAQLPIWSGGGPAEVPLSKGKVSEGKESKELPKGTSPQDSPQQPVHIGDVVKRLGIA